jgi:hypothetical protein
MERAVRTVEPATLRFGTRRRQAGQVDEVPRSSTSRTTIPFVLVACAVMCFNRL